MKWPTIEQFSAMCTLPPGYRFEALKRADIPALIEAIQRWHPDIAVGGGSCYLREDFYTSKIFRDGESEKDIFVGMFKRGDDLASICSWEQEPTKNCFGLARRTRRQRPERRLNCCFQPRLRRCRNPPWRQKNEMARHR